jgi:hypothetical protein
MSLAAAFAREPQHAGCLALAQQLSSPPQIVVAPRRRAGNDNAVVAHYAAVGSARQAMTRGADKPRKVAAKRRAASASPKLPASRHRDNVSPLSTLHPKLPRHPTWATRRDDPGYVLRACAIVI